MSRLKRVTRVYGEQAEEGYRGVVSRLKRVRGVW